MARRAIKASLARDGPDSRSALQADHTSGTNAETPSQSRVRPFVRIAPLGVRDASQYESSNETDNQSANNAQYAAPRHHCDPR